MNEKMMRTGLTELVSLLRKHGFLLGEWKPTIDDLPMVMNKTNRLIVHLEQSLPRTRMLKSFSCGRELKMLRLRDRVSMKYLSNFTGIDEEELYEVEHGLRLPSDQTIFIICRYFNVDFNHYKTLLDNDRKENE